MWSRRARFEGVEACGSAGHEFEAGHAECVGEGVKKRFADQANKCECHTDDLWSTPSGTERKTITSAPPSKS